MTRVAEESKADGAAVARPLWRRAPARLPRIFAWTIVGGVAVAFLMRLLRIEQGALSYAVAAIPWLTFAIIVLAIACASFRSWRLAAAAGALALVGSAWLAPVVIPDRGAGEAELTVSAINLRVGHADPDEVVALVVDRDIEVVAFIEVTERSVDALAAAGLEDVLPYFERHPGRGAGGTAIYSRYPLTGAEVVVGTSFPTVRAQVEAPGGSFTFYAVHPRPPRPDNTERWLKDMGVLERVLADEAGQVLVAGDFNSTRDHAAFRKLLAAGYRNATDQAGAGFLPTFPEGRRGGPLVGIDHVLVRDSWLVAVDVSSVALTGTDHRAVVVQYAPAAAE